MIMTEPSKSCQEQARKIAVDIISNIFDPDITGFEREDIIKTILSKSNLAELLADKERYAFIERHFNAAVQNRDWQTCDFLTEQIRALKDKYNGFRRPAKKKGMARQTVVISPKEIAPAIKKLSV